MADAVETPLENTEHLSRDMHGKAGETEIAELEAFMSGAGLLNPSPMLTRHNAIRASTLALAKVVIAQMPPSEPRRLAFIKLREFFTAAKEAAAFTV